MKHVILLQPQCRSVLFLFCFVVWICCFVFVDIFFIAFVCFCVFFQGQMLDGSCFFVCLFFP